MARINIFSNQKNKKMKDFLFIYRADNAASQRSEEEAKSMMQRWIEWLGSIAAKNKLTDRGNRLQSSGKIVKANDVITNGPYSEIKESIGGYSLVKADSYEDAIELAKSCPVLSVGGNVEIREIAAM